MIGSGELLVILCITLLLFGGKRLPEIARNLGKGIREFKRACNGLDEELDDSPKEKEISVPVKHIDKLDRE